LPLPDDYREGVGIEYLNKKYTRYINLVENSEILNPMNKKRPTSKYWPENVVLLFVVVVFCRPMTVRTF